MTERSHGYARYKLDGCRCYTCAWAVSEYERNRQRAIIAGTWQPFVDAAPIRAHIEAHQAAGIGYKRLARIAGVGDSTIKAILYGRRGNQPSGKVRREVAERLLAIAVGEVQHAGHANIDATSTHRRIRALVAIGWSLSAQARRVGWTVTNYAAMLRRPRVNANTARLVTGLYEQLSMTPAPPGRSSGRARRWAALQGWLPPLAWDDDTIDDPAAKPARNAIRQVAA